MTDLLYNKTIDLEDFNNEQLSPYLKQIARSESLRFGLAEPEIVPDSKQWECAMMLRTLVNEGVAKSGALLAGIGAGIEETTYALAEMGCVTFPTDRYLEVTPWSDVAPATMMIDPSLHSSTPFPTGNIIPVHSDARVIALPDNFVTGVYSAGSIEHYGSLEAVAASAQEMARILKPGGVAVLSTEFRLDGPNGIRWWDDNCILFTEQLIKEFIVEPSGLELIGEANFDPSPGTFNSKVVLVDFLGKAKSIQSMADKRDAYPNLVLYHEGFLFCSVHLALRKPKKNSVPLRHDFAEHFVETVSNEKRAASSALANKIFGWTAMPGLNLPQARDRIIELEEAYQNQQSLIQSLQLELTTSEGDRRFLKDEIRQYLHRETVQLKGQLSSSQQELERSRLLIAEQNRALGSLWVRIGYRLHPLRKIAASILSFLRIR